MAAHWTADEVCDLLDEDFCFSGSDDDFDVEELEDYDALQREQGEYKYTA